MGYDLDVVATKLRRWEKYLYNFRLPTWEEIPDFGLYMDQVIRLLTEYLDYLPPEIKGEHVITAATINNYVRMKVMPIPKKKRYGRIHMAYLIMICTLKQSMSIAMIQQLLPPNLKDEEMRDVYNRYVTNHHNSAKRFIEMIRAQAAPILNHDCDIEEASEELICFSALVGGFAHVFSEKLTVLDGLTPASPGIDLSVPERLTE